MNSPALTPRAERVPFSRAVVVTPVDGSLPEMKLQGANLSKSGMFVKSADALPPGTKVSLSLEAKGQEFPFAEAEVVWQRPAEKATDEVIPGFGLRFVNFLHPRAPELVDALLDKAAKKKAALEKFAAPPEKFTELSLPEEPKLLLAPPRAEAKPEPEPLEAPPIPRRTKTDPEFVKSGESLVIDLQKELPPEVSFDEDDGDQPPSAFRSGWPKMMAALAFAPLFLVPVGVAIGTWRASKTPEPTVDTRTVEFTTAKPVEPPSPVVIANPTTQPANTEAVAIDPPPQLMVEPPVANSSPEKIETEPLVESPPAKARAEHRTARVEVTPAPTKASSAVLPLQLAAVSSISTSNDAGALALSLALTNGASIKRAFALKAPHRLVIDIQGATAPKSAVHEFSKTAGVYRVRVGAQPDGVRLVVDLANSATRVTVTGSKVIATLTP